MAVAMRSVVAWDIWLCPTSAAGARSQAPMQGARTMRTSSPTLSSSAAIRASAPIISQVSESQTRTVTGGGRGSSSPSTSKWA